MTNEIMKDAELDEVSGGSGVECIALMTRLQNAGLATFKTPLMPGNEVAATAELKDFLSTFKKPNGEPVFGHSEIYSDDTANDYRIVSVTGQNGEIVAFRHYDTDSMVELIRALKGR